MTFVSSSSAQQIAWSDHGLAGTTIDSDTLVITKPAGAAAGDILVAGVSTEAYGVVGNVRADDITWTRILLSSSIFIFWKVAGASEPSSYTFHSFFSSGTTPQNAFMNGIMGCWTGWTGPVRKALVTDSGSKVTNHFNLVFAPDPPNVIDIASETLQDVTAPIETTTGGLLVTFWDIFEGIENFDGTIGTPPYPASIPYANATATAPDTQHNQIYYYGSPRGGESVLAIPNSGITYRANNHQLTMSSQEVVAGNVPGSSASFTWQHAGAEAGFSEIVFGVRLLLEATAIARAYWGIDAILQ